ncbi:MAG: TRAP transporter substrate-binding protein DctP [Spirochaetales bacterium]|nr:TRAP transporter substrate-binding protein DctP [Spirochaetales bacterium]
MKKIVGVLAFVLSGLMFLTPLSAVDIKLGSPLPEGTVWDTSLRRMADEWRTITKGRVRVRIYPGGIAGGEGDMIRKMRIGQLDAGVFSPYGLKVMVPESFTFILPGLVQTEEELNALLLRYSPTLEDKFRQAGFEMLAWSLSGWAYPFSKTPAYFPEDLMQGTMAVDDSEVDLYAALKSLGFDVEPMPINEIMVGLQSGLVDSMLVPPVAAAAYQWFGLASTMTDVRLTPVLGGLVLSKRAWRSIPEEYHEELKASMERVAQEFTAESERLGNEALRVMLENGLEVVPVEEKDLSTWSQFMIQGHELMVGEGKAIPQEFYDAIRTDLEELRRQG